VNNNNDEVIITVVNNNDVISIAVDNNNDVIINDDVIIITVDNNNDDVIIIVTAIDNNNDDIIMRSCASTWREGERERGRNGGREKWREEQQWGAVPDCNGCVCAHQSAIWSGTPVWVILTVLPSTQSVRIPAAEDPAPQRNDQCVAEIEKWHSVAHQLQSTAGISANKDT